jgi:hypothetical protein
MLQERLQNIARIGQRGVFKSVDELVQRTLRARSNENPNPSSGFKSHDILRKSR